MSLLILMFGRIAPIFLVMAVGFVAYSFRWVDSAFVKMANTVTFRVALPCLVFTSILEGNFSGGFPVSGIAAFIAGIGGATAVAYAVAYALGLKRKRRASFVQGSMRGNLAIVAFAVFQLVLGPSSLQRAAVYLAFFMIIHNLVGIPVLSGVDADGEAGSGLLRRTARTLGATFGNPLMVAIYLGGAAALLKLKPPQFIMASLDYLGQLALPLALFGVGGAIRVYYRENHLPLAGAASLIKLIVMPAISIVVGVLLRLPAEDLIMVGVFAGSPAAVATYSLADGMGADPDTAGSIIIVTHVACAATLAALITIVRSIF